MKFRLISLLVLFPIFLSAQIYTRPPYRVSIADGPNLDAFSRLRVSNPTSVFDGQLTYDLQPLLYDTITVKSGTSITHDATNRVANMAFSSTPTGGEVAMQTFEFFRYQPLKSQLIAITFNFEGGTTNVEKYAGYGDESNHIRFSIDGTSPRFMITTSTDAADETVAQGSWNLDKMNGTGPSGYTLDISKTQILIIDLQALYVGRVRVGFDVEGEIVYAHEFVHANVFADPYLASASLPIRIGMKSSGTVSSTMQFICSAVVSEGGQEEVTGYDFSIGSSVTAGNGTATHAISIRPDTLFNSITNRAKFILGEVDITVTGSNPVFWELVLGQELSGTTTFSEVNSLYSAMDYNTAGTLSGDPAIVVASGYVPATAQGKGVLSKSIPSRYPITLDHLGLPRSLGTLSIRVTGVGGTSATQAVLNWKEIR